MKRYIALLRGINISGKNKVSMANLKKSFEALGWSHLPVNARFTGFCVGMMGDVIFLLSVLCIKDSWRAGIPDKDKTELVTTGIYHSAATLRSSALTLCMSVFCCCTETC